MSAFLLAYIPAGLIFNAIYLVLLLRDCRGRWRDIAAEPGSPVLLGLYCAAVQFLSAFGVSDFAIHMIVWRKFRLVPDEKLPGTMLSACIIPQLVMGLAYISTVPVELTTLLLSIACSLAGALLGVRLVTRLSGHLIRRMICAALLLSSVMMLLGLLHVTPASGAADGLSGWRLWLHCAITLLLSALSMAGFPTTALKMSACGAMGLSARAAYPLSCGSAALTIPFAGMAFIRRGAYCRKLTLISTAAGSLGALAAVTLVRSLNITLLQWGVAVLALYTGVSMLLEELAAPRPSAGKSRP